MDQNKNVDYLGNGNPHLQGHTFAVELCELKFNPQHLPAYNNTANHNEYKLGDIPSNIREGNAYWTSEDNSSKEFNVEYSFENGKFSSEPNDDDEYTGFTLQYASQENCGTVDEPKPFVFTINGHCD